MNHENHLKEIIEQIKKEWEIPGVAVGIGDENGILFEHYTGYGDLEQDQQVDQDTVFCLASMGKFVVALAVMHFHQEKILNINDPMIKYIPTFQFDSAYDRNITIKMLLSHRSGLPDAEMKDYLMLLNRDLTLDEYISMMRAYPMEKPGTHFRYSNFGYTLLAEIIQTVTQKHFSDAMQDILNHLDMKDSYFGYPKDFSNLAYPYLRVPVITRSPSYPYSELELAPSFMHSTVRDMLKLYNNMKNIISEDLFKEMTTILSNRNYPPFYESTGMGINIGHFQNELVFSHGGMGFGFSGFYMIFPERKLSAILLMNEESFAHDQIYYAIAQVITNQRPTKALPSWIIPLSKYYQKHGIDDTIKETKKMISSKSSKYSIEKEDLVNLIYQMIVIKNASILSDFVKLSLKVYPQDQEVLDLKHHFLDNKIFDDLK